MPKASKETAPEPTQVEGYEGYITDLGDGYTIAFETYTADAHLSPFFAGCRMTSANATTGAFVIKVKVTYKTSDGEETFEAGEAHYVGPGHTPVLARSWSSSAQPTNCGARWKSW